METMEPSVPLTLTFRLSDIIQKELNIRKLPDMFYMIYFILCVCVCVTVSKWCYHKDSVSNMLLLAAGLTVQLDVECATSVL